jgi:hypothetical protein
LARAIVVARARLNKDTDKSTWGSVRKGDQPAKRNYLQTTLAKELMAKAGLENFQDLCGIPELKKLQDVLSPDGYQLKVFSKDIFNDIFYKGEVVDATQIINLYLHDGHYDVITKVPAFFGHSYYCHDCNKAYNNAERHCCKRGECPGCNAAKKCPKGVWKICVSCNR